MPYQRDPLEIEAEWSVKEGTPRLSDLKRMDAPLTMEIAMALVPLAMAGYAASQRWFVTSVFSAVAGLLLLDIVDYRTRKDAECLLSRWENRRWDPQGRVGLPALPPIGVVSLYIGFLIVAATAIGQTPAETVSVLSAVFGRTQVVTGQWPLSWYHVVGAIGLFGAGAAVMWSYDHFFGGSES